MNTLQTLIHTAEKKGIFAVTEQKSLGSTQEYDYTDISFSAPLPSGIIAELNKLGFVEVGQSGTFTNAGLHQLLTEVEGLMISEMNCGASLPKLEKWEKTFATWKTTHGFSEGDDCESIADTIRMRLEGHN